MVHQHKAVGHQREAVGHQHEAVGHQREAVVQREAVALQREAVVTQHEAVLPLRRARWARADTLGWGRHAGLEPTLLYHALCYGAVTRACRCRADAVTRHHRPPKHVLPATTTTTAAAAAATAAAAPAPAADASY